MTDSVKEKIHQELSKYPRREYPKGQIIVFADENPEHIYYMVKGRVRMYDVSYRGDEVVVNIFKPLSFFPMSWAINKTPNKYFYKTEAETVMHIVPTDEALEFLRTNPDVTLDLLGRLYSGIDGMMGRMVHLMSGTARSRLINELIIECRRFGNKQASGGYLLTTNEVDLAAHSGLSRETVSREIRKMKKLNWVEVSNKGIAVLDINLLADALGDDLSTD